MGLTIRFSVTVLVLLGAALAPGLARAAASMAGPVEARVITVVDGDTLRVAARIWLGQEVETLVRIDGIDAPELRGRCRQERTMARAARELLAGRVGSTVLLRDIAHGKYAGRVVARVLLPEGADVATLLLKAGLARPYDGRSRRPWCEPAG